MSDESPEQGASRLAARVLDDGYVLAALHCYHDADHAPLFWRIRCTHPHKAKWMRPMYHDGAQYRFGEPPAGASARPLYRLPSLLLGDPDLPVWIVEGELCADSLAALGLLATTSGSAASAASADWTPLQGRKVRVWPDQDPAGARYANAVIDKLQRLGCKIERIDTARIGVPPKGDCVDWLAAHPTATAADIEALPRVTQRAASEEAQVILTRASDVEPRSVDWLWSGWLAAGKLHLLGGAPGTGKTTVALALAATITQGGHWPDGAVASTGNVVIWSGEDDHADTLIPRLRVAGANAQRVYVVGSVVEQGKSYPFNPAQDIEGLRDALKQVPDVRLIVVDPLVSMISGDSHKNAEVRRGLQPLVELASELRCAVLGITHFSKGTSGRDPLERITGSVAFGALARLVMVVAERDEQSDDAVGQRVLVRAKTNIGPNGGGFAYHIEQVEVAGYPGIEASKVVWDETVEGTARDLLAASDQTDQDRPATDDAKQWLATYLEAGPVSAKKVISLARQFGFSEKVLRRARTALGVETKRLGFGADGGWEWYLPPIKGAQSSHTSPLRSGAPMNLEGFYEDPTDSERTQRAPF